MTKGNKWSFGILRYVANLEKEMHESRYVNEVEMKETHDG